MLGGAICSWVRKFFYGEAIDRELNNAFLVLIPKTQAPEVFTQFHPINLCSILYKLVMKFIANKFKVVFLRIMGQELGGFIVGRNIKTILFWPKK